MAGKFSPVDELANFLNRPVQQSQQSTSMIGWHMLSEHISQKRWWQQQQKKNIFLGILWTLAPFPQGIPRVETQLLPSPSPSPLCQTTQLQSCRVERWASGKAGGFRKKHLNVFTSTVPLDKNDAVEKTHFITLCFLEVGKGNFSGGYYYCYLLQFVGLIAWEEPYSGSHGTILAESPLAHGYGTGCQKQKLYDTLE